MSLLKTVPTCYGVNATYHKITVTEMDWQKKVAIISLDGFIDEAAKTANKAPIFHSEFSFSGNDFTGFATNVDNVAVAYNKIKAQSDWANATDV